jgi:SSS family solute:Na+ symporter
MSWELLGISLYVIGMIAMGFYFSKRIKTDDDYFLAGRNLGPWLTTFAIFATWFGAETCIGTAGAVYRGGLSGIHADPVGYTICLLIMGLFLAKALWNKKITTVPDLFRTRYSPATEKIAALIIIPGSIIWAGAQVRALGQIIHLTTDFGPMVAVTIAAAVVVTYTMAGGMFADAYGDFIQGIAIIVGMLLLFFAVLWNSGGPVSAFQSISPDKLNFGDGKMMGLSLLGKFELWLVPILGSVLSQELVSRVVASKSEKVAYQSTLRAAGIYFFIGLIPVFIGLVGYTSFPHLRESEMLLPLIAKQHLNAFGYVIFIGSLVAAILSTVDTTLLASSALLSHNIIYPAFPELPEKRKILLARACTLFSGVFCYVIAYSSDSIMELIETASSLGGPSVLIVTLTALWEKRGTAFNAIFAMVMSVLTWAVGHVMNLEFKVILTVVVCAIAYFGTLPFTRKGRV